jgi:hypothetical protein
MGTSVALEIETGNVNVIFREAANPTTVEIKGDYAVTGGTCDQTGTVVVLVYFEPMGLLRSGSASRLRMLRIPSTISRPTF